MTELVILEGILWLIRFLFGACIFSFLGVVADRLPRDEGIVKGRSHCTACGRVLPPAELIPSVSFLALRGRCKGCGTLIPKRAFLGELAGGAAWILCAWRYGVGHTGLISLEGAVVFCYLGILLVVALIDWDTQIIYNRFHIIIAILAAAQIFLVPGARNRGSSDRRADCVGSHAGAGADRAGSLRRRRHQAYGGVRAFSRHGRHCLRHVFRPAFRRRLRGLMLATKRLKKSDQFAFGPFLAFGLAVAALWGDQIAAWYLSAL